MNTPAHHPDAYFTPPALVLALLERERFDGPVWEPACGDGAISEVLTALGHEVVSTDLLDYGYASQRGRLDFLAEPPDFPFESIVTNPPYTGKVIRPWVRRCCRRYRPRKVALLLPINGFADFADPSLLGPDMRLSRVILFARRKAKFTHAGGSVFAHRWPICWFVAERGFRGEARIEHHG